jgi:hypothetical protein
MHQTSRWCGLTLDNRCVLSGDGVNYFVTVRQLGKAVRQETITNETTALAIASKWLEEQEQRSN